jgi:hypothetical protein
MAGIAARATWVFGADPDAAAPDGTHKKHNNVVNSTGVGATLNCHGWGLNYSYAIESNDSGWSYQIRLGRTSSGPWSVISSNSGTSTALLDYVQNPGPQLWVSPRVKTLASTANYVIVRMTGLDG